MQVFSRYLGLPTPESVLHTGTDKSASQQVFSEPQEPNLSWVLGRQGQFCLPALGVMGWGKVGAG